MLRHVVLGVLGLLELLAPRRVVGLSTRLAYHAPGDFDVRPWVVTAVRLEGLAFLLLAARGLRRNRKTTSSRRASRRSSGVDA